VKKKTILLGLVLAMALVMVAPGAALAAKPATFEAVCSISAIDEGDPFAAGQSGRWVVPERTIIGTVTGDINGDFVLTYKANVAADQAGNFHGEMVVTNPDDSWTIKLNGKSGGTELVGWSDIPTGNPQMPYLPILSITINGHWTFVDGAQGNGTFNDAAIVFIGVPDEQGNMHIGPIVPGSAIVMSGK
jgi:hypothetical protein